MLIHLSLKVRGQAGSQRLPELTVETGVEVDAADPTWASRLVDGVTERAHQGAHRLVTELTPRTLSNGRQFIPLADVTRVLDCWA